jgi:hypothetical protein
MTTQDLQRYIGLECLYTVNGLEVLCRIDDAKVSYGRRRFLVSPIAGANSVWVETGLQLPHLKEETREESE